MNPNTDPHLSASQKCQGQCKQCRPLADFYAAGTNNTTPRKVCKDCWKAVNSKAYAGRVSRNQQRNGLLALSHAIRSR